MTDIDTLPRDEDAPAAQTAPAPIDPAEAEIRRRQRMRAIIMAVLLAAFVVLVYAISIARMTLGH